MSGGQMHWIITFAEAQPFGSKLYTADGVMDPHTQPNRRAAFRAIEADVKAHLGISENAVVTFFALEPNDLVEPTATEGGQEQ